MTDRLPPQIQLWTWPAHLEPGRITRSPAPRPPPPVRIGDAERDRAISTLGDHFAAGRLDPGGVRHPGRPGDGRPLRQRPPAAVRRPAAHRVQPTTPPRVRHGADHAQRVAADADVVAAVPAGRLDRCRRPGRRPLADLGVRLGPGDDVDDGSAPAPPRVATTTADSPARVSAQRPSVLQL